MRFHLIAAVGSFALARPFIGAPKQSSSGARKACFAPYAMLAAAGRAVAKGFDRLFQAIERAQCSQREAFFAEAVDLCDLEHRIRHYEHTGSTRY